MNQSNHYDAIIIGFGKGGKTLEGVLGNVGKKTVLIEKFPKMYGGTCINVGCIPTKFLVHMARDAKFTEDKAAYYEEAVKAELALTEKLRGKNLAKAENAPNVTVITDTAKLLSGREVEVATEKGTDVLTAEQIFLNTASVPFVPPIEGIKDNPYRRPFCIGERSVAKHPFLQAKLGRMGFAFERSEMFYKNKNRAKSEMIMLDFISRLARDYG